LLARLSERARQAGISRFTAVTAADNAAMAGLLRSAGAELTHRGHGTLEYQVALAHAEYSLDWWLDCVDDGSVFAWP
jgi:RimJ/RimL family protein N-acetyltransferase